jgi:adenosylmethionine-8-amino-7-oxononanoate aminotransferase
MDALSLQERDRAHVWHPWSPLTADRSELMITRGDGYRVWDAQGNEYIDATSLNTTCGYARPEVERAVSQQIMRLHQFDLSRASHEPAGLLAERISSYLPEQMSKTLFVNSGSEGFDAASLIAASYWSHLGERRTRLVTFARGYQGSTLLSRSMSALPRVAHPFRPPMPVTRVELPMPPAMLRRPESLPSLLAAFEQAIDVEPADPAAAVVVEPFLNVGGGVVLPAGFLRGLRELCSARRTLMILDEVFTGYGRTGRMFACNREDVEPDILVSSKGLSGGYVPIGAVTVGRRIHDSFDRDQVVGGVRYGHTTSGHPVACAAALATLDIVEKEGLVSRAESHGARLRARLAPLAGTRAVVDIRGLGLILVLEMSSALAAGRLVSCARDHGLLVRQAGAAIMAVPAMVIDDYGIDALADRLVRAVDVAGRPAS